MSSGLVQCYHPARQVERAANDRESDMPSTIRPIVLACDEAYAMPLATTLRSIVDSSASQEPLAFHVLTTGMSREARARILNSLPPGRASIDWVPIDLADFETCQTRAHISQMTYARLLLPRLFPNLSIVLYLDADILVLRDLAGLWATDLAGAAVAAVLDGMDGQIKRGDPAVHGVPRVQSYFNAGVLLIDLDRWRSERISERAMDFLSRHPDSPFSDQDALNVACDGRWTRLDAQWNCQAHLQHHALAGMPADHWPGIIHFVTAGKPWNRWVPNANAGVYDSFRSRTLYARTLSERAHDHVLGMIGAVKEASKRRSLGRVVYRILKQARSAASMVWAMPGR